MTSSKLSTSSLVMSRQDSIGGCAISIDRLRLDESVDEVHDIWGCRGLLLSLAQQGVLFRSMVSRRRGWIALCAVNCVSLP